MPKKHCSHCRSLQVKLHGKTKSGVQRFYCNACHKTFSWQRPDVSRQKEQAWFKLWVTESFSIRQISKLSGHSTSKLKRVIDLRQSRRPEKCEPLKAH